MSKTRKQRPRRDSFSPAVTTGLSAKKILKGLTPEQCTAVQHFEGPALVLASPGSGKTASLTSRIVYLIGPRHVAPSSVLAVTFTNKAAREMRERVNKLIPDTVVSEEISISTFHSLCARLLREDHARFGVSSRFTICDETDTKSYLLQAAAHVLGVQSLSELELEKKTMASGLNLSFRLIRKFVSEAKQNLKTSAAMTEEAVADPIDALLVKIYEKYDQIMDRANSLDFDDLLFRVVRKLQLDEQLRKDLADVYDFVLVDEYQDTNVAQFNLARYLTQRTKNLWVCGDPDQCLLPHCTISTPRGDVAIKDCCAGDAIISAAEHGSTSVQSIGARSYNYYIGPALSLRTERGHEVVVTPNHYCFYRDASTKCLYEGMPEVRDWFWFGSEGEPPYCVGRAERVGLEAEVPVLDEATQTIVGDKLILITSFHYEGLVHDLSIPEVHNYIAGGIVVHNSIYQFRGADLSNILLFEKHYPGARTYRLEANFRSRPAITAVANAIIRHNTSRPSKEIKPVRAAAAGDEVRCFSCANQDHQAAIIGHEIKSLLNRGAKPKDFALLYRTKVQSRAHEDIMIRLNIPYRVVGSFGFYNRAVVKDLLSYFKLIQNSRDDASFTRIYNKPARRLGEVAFGRFCAIAEKHEVSLSKALRQKLYQGEVGPEAERGFSQLGRALHALRELDRGAVGPLMQAVAKLSGYRKWLEDQATHATPSQRTKAASWLEHLHEMIEATYHFDEERGTGLEAYLEWVTLAQQDDQEDEEARNKVLLMTCHAAKGLEFSNVYVVGSSDNYFPCLRYSDERDRPYSKAAIAQALEEERRIFFVATTRAQNHLTYSWFRDPPPYQERRTANRPSRFLAEAGDTVRYIDMNSGSDGAETRAVPRRSNKSYQQRPAPRPSRPPAEQLELGSDYTTRIGEPEKVEVRPGPTDSFDIADLFPQKAGSIAALLAQCTPAKHRRRR